GLLLIGLTLLPGCGSSGGSGNVEVIELRAPDSPQEPAASDPRVKQSNIVSAITGITYPLRIYLPEDYASSNESYPIIYATDGQWIFDGFASTLDEKGVDAILVAIGQGPDGRRNVDYLLPGAREYYRFLITEL